MHPPPRRGALGDTQRNLAPPAEGLSEIHKEIWDLFFLGLTTLLVLFGAVVLLYSSKVLNQIGRFSSAPLAERLSEIHKEISLLARRGSRRYTKKSGTFFFPKRCSHLGLVTKNAGGAICSDSRPICPNREGVWWWSWHQ